MKWAMTVLVGFAVLSGGCKKSKKAPRDAVAVAHDAAVKPPEETVKIGVIHSATGTLAPFGEPVGQGLQLALEEINAAGGVKGKKVELVIEDDGSDPQRAVKAFEKLASTDKVVAIIGPTSADATRATAPLAQRFGIVQVTPTAHEADLADLPNTFVMFPTVEQVSERVAKTIAGKFKAKKVAIINPANKWGEQSTAAMRRSLTEAGAQVVAAETFQEGSEDFNTTLAKIKRSAPQVLVYPGYYDKETLALTKAVVSQAAYRDIIIIIVGAACRELLRDPLLDNERFRRNIYIVDEGGAFAIPGNERSAAFRKGFLAKFNDAPSTYAAASHAALFAVKDALETGAPLTESLKSVKSNTAFGEVAFANGLNRGAAIEFLQPAADKQLQVIQ